MLYYSLFAVFTDWAVFALRLAVGAVLVAHGIPKMKGFSETAAWMSSVGFRPGTLWAAVSILVEVGCGFLLLAGIFAQWAAFLVVGEFAVIVAWRLLRRDKFIGATELDLLLLTGALILVTFGPGALSLEGILVQFLSQ
jgi:putative oxidoreductase